MIWNIYLTIAVNIVAALLLITYLLPDAAVVTRSAQIKAEPAAIYHLLSSNKDFQKINPYKAEDPSLTITLQGPESGVGSAFLFEGKEGKGSQTITALQENQSVTMLIDLGALGKPVQVFTLTPSEQGTMVTWTVESRFGFNPVFRGFGLFMDGMFGPKYELGLKKLAQTVTEKNHG